VTGIPEEVGTWLNNQGYGFPISLRNVSGGCIHHSLQVETESGQSFFLKTNPHAPRDMFSAEAEGLRKLLIEDGPRVPEVLLVGDHFLLLEDLRPGLEKPAYWVDFGEQLAALHTNTSDHFGLEINNYIGATPQINTREENGWSFFANHRLLFQGALALENGYLQVSELAELERICEKLPDIIPEQPASLLHGDLWSGNVLSDMNGSPAVIDPAVYFGWAEADLAMTDLFGSFPNDFYNAYQSVRNLEPGFRERYPIYNLYHLLNHLNLFGQGYYSRVTQVLRRYS
jgi:fructosamine-3-kinase